MNKTYEAKFGHIFIICASGKSASNMLAALQHRQVTPCTHMREQELPLFYWLIKSSGPCKLLLKQACGHHVLQTQDLSKLVTGRACVKLLGKVQGAGVLQVWQ